jgi:hypothetical protein
MMLSQLRLFATQPFAAKPPPNLNFAAQPMASWPATNSSSASSTHIRLRSNSHWCHYPTSSFHTFTINSTSTPDVHVHSCTSTPIAPSNNPFNNHTTRHSSSTFITGNSRVILLPHHTIIDQSNVVVGCISFATL